MPARRNPTPSYLLHKQSGRARAVWTDRDGNRQQKLLPGEYNSPESLAAFARLQLELATSPTAAIPAPGVGGTVSTRTVAEVLSAYLDFAERHYRDAAGNPTSKLNEVKLVIRSIRELYAALPVSEFGPLKLKAVRQSWVTRGIVRTEVNARTGMAKRAFKWAVSEELAPPSVFQALAAVAGLQRGRTEAKESEPVGPVPDAVVDATLPFLNRHVRGLVEFQRLTGCRPGEACALRPCELDTSGAVWLYRPKQHKTAHKGKSRVVTIGPRAQALLREFLTDDPEAFLFSPRRAVEEVRTDRAAKRKTPRYGSSAGKRKRKAKPARTPKDKYGRNAYIQAVHRACDRAFPPPGELARRKGESVAKWRARLTAEQRERVKEWQHEHQWNPNQLRHSFATAVRKAHGLEAAQVLLGHSKADVTQVYAERNEGLATNIAAKIG